MVDITQELISYKKCSMEKWSISDIEDIRFFQGNLQFCNPFNNGDR